MVDAVLEIYRGRGYSDTAAILAGIRELKIRGAADLPEGRAIVAELERRMERIRRLRRGRVCGRR